jgi:hypothetical protein
MKKVEGQEPQAEVLVTITGTGKSKHLPKGSTFAVPPAEAEHLISLGRAKKGGDENTEPEEKEKKEVEPVKEKATVKHTAKNKK